MIPRADGKCEECGSMDGVMIHHKNGYSNELSDLVVLCKKCHGKAHSGNYVESDVESGVEKFHTDIRDKIIDKDINICPISEQSDASEPSESIKKESARKKQESAEQDALFDKAYALYPRHEKKKDARKAWGKIRPIPNESFVERIDKVVRNKFASGIWTEGDTKHIPLFATFLNGERWEDEMIKPQRGTTSEQRSLWETAVPFEH